MKSLLAVAVATITAASSAVTVANERNASSYPGDQAEVAITADPSNPQILLGVSGGPARTRTYTSTDGGKSWSSRTDVPDTELAGDGIPAIDRAGHEYLGFVTGSYSPPESHFVVATRDGPFDQWRRTNRPIVDTLFHDKPMLIVDAAPESPFPGRLYVGGVEFRPGSGTAKLVLTHSDDRGATWSPPVTLGVGRREVPQFLTLAVGRGGALYAGWMVTDGFLWVTRSLDGGTTFDRPQEVVDLAARDGAWTVPAQTVPGHGDQRGVTATPLLRVDTTKGPASGRVYLGYEDRVNGRTNVYVLRLTPDLTPLGPPVAVVPPARADRFLPVIDVDPVTGEVWDCFYATDGSRDLHRTRYSCASSLDGGASWSPLVPVASAFSRVTRKTADITFGYGDYEGLAVAGGVAHPMWTDARAANRTGSEIFTASLTR
ncbi:MAG: hypothetical protein E6G60_15025 [Actinobacteria bacterium]|nr:MAG: hypothetical protein E6G60_15025 [Actinomycetota bacterium]